MPKYIAAPETVLAAAVASPAGTTTVAYPSGSVQADFTGVNADTNAYIILNGVDRFTEVSDKFDISYGAGSVTITNKTGYTWPIGTKLAVALARASSPVAPSGGATVDAEARAGVNQIRNVLAAQGLTL